MFLTEEQHEKARFAAVCLFFVILEIVIFHCRETYQKKNKQKENKMFEIKEIHDPNEKSSICDNILKALPNWFGNMAAIDDYAKQVRTMPFYAAFDQSSPIGFAALKIHNTYTSEICVMGVLKEYHRQGIGRKLIETCEKHCTENQTEFLTVKTLDESRESKSYAKTRLFYFSMGFRPLEVFPLLWDKDNPCLFLAKSIKK